MIPFKPAPSLRTETTQQQNIKKQKEKKNPSSLSTFHNYSQNNTTPLSHPTAPLQAKIPKN
jgi:hypothetical protein